MRVAGGDRGLTPLDAAESHLRACELCWLATNGPHGLTCCTLYYALPEPWCLLVMSSERPRHVANLKTDSACSVCVPRLPSYFGEPARQLTARCDGFPVVDPLRVDAEAELFYARYPPARDFVDQVKRTRVEAELVPIRLRLREGEYLDDERYGVDECRGHRRIPVECRRLLSPLPGPRRWLPGRLPRMARVRSRGDTSRPSPNVARLLLRATCGSLGEPV